MSYKDKTYVVFDGYNDKWAYARMKGWKASENIDFDFEDAHEVYSMTSPLLLVAPVVVGRLTNNSIIRQL